MTRAKTDNDPADTDTEQTATAPSTQAEAAPAPAEDTTGQHEPYPGPTFFHGGRHSEIITAMARRLEAEGHGDGRHLGPDWTNAHRDAFARFQHMLRPKGSGDVSGIPDETAWDRLKVPRVTPLPRET